jgi:hypothetical protein
MIESTMIRRYCSHQPDHYAAATKFDIDNKTRFGYPGGYCLVLNLSAVLENPPQIGIYPISSINHCGALQTYAVTRKNGPFFANL